MPAGHNGPWHDLDTPVRTTAHWAILFQKAHELTGEPSICQAATAACDYLLRSEARPYGMTFHCRNAGSAKDRCNGLIGQAWAVESLLSVGRARCHQPYLDAAIAVLRLHPYCPARHGWSAVEIDGGALPLCRTVNQQVWFAAMCLEAGDYAADLRERALDFFRHLPAAVRFLRTGLVQHSFDPGTTRGQRLRGWVYGRMRKVASPSQAAAERRMQVELSAGYQSFLLYGIAMAAARVGPNPLWGPRADRRLLWPCIGYLMRAAPQGAGDGNRFAWGYNPLGIEMAYVLRVLGAPSAKAEPRAASPQYWLHRQIEAHFDWQSGLLNRGTGDPAILAARLYEACRLDDCELTLAGATP